MNEYDNYKQAEPTHEIDDDFYEYIQSHRDCCICGDKNVSEEIMYRTYFGWMHVDCFEDISKNAADDGSEIPELL